MASSGSFAVRSLSPLVVEAEAACTLGLLFAYATNGTGIVEFDFTTGIERAVDDLPSLKALWHRYRVANGLGEALENKLLVANHRSDKVPRYCQQIAINRAVEAILAGQRRVLLALATGTGKTVIAFQITWRLRRGEWNARGIPDRRPRILVLAGGSVLVDDPKDKRLPFLYPSLDAAYSSACDCALRILAPAPSSEPLGRGGHSHLRETGYASHIRCLHWLRLRYQSLLTAVEFLIVELNDINNRICHRLGIFQVLLG